MSAGAARHDEQDRRDHHDEGERARRCSSGEIDSGLAIPPPIIIPAQYESPQGSAAG